MSKSTVSKHLEPSLSCWSCHAQVDKGIFCRACGVLQPLSDHQDVFSYFGRDACYSLDQAVLEERYFEQQKNVHPDKFAARSEREKIYASMHSAFVNDAYKALKDPCKRADQLLKALGQDSSDVHAALDIDFLEAIMERQELLASIADSATLQEFITLEVKNINDLENELSLHFSVHNFPAVYRVLHALKYAYKLMFDAQKRQKEFR